jgi:S-adenosyl methyltransferase
MIRLRTFEEIEQMLAGLEVVEPGLVFGPQWRTDRADEVDAHPERIGFLAAAGRKA